MSCMDVTYTASNADNGQYYNNRIYYNRMYYQLRTTVQTLGKTEVPESKYLVFFRKILEYVMDSKTLKDVDPYICSDVEKRDKYDEKTHPHYHLNFLSVKSKPTIQKWITRNCKKYLGYQLRGNAQYALQDLDTVEDYDRWMRYCVKMGPPKLDLTNWEYESHMPLAIDERKRSVESNKKYRESKRQKVTLYDKIDKMLKKAKKSNYRDIYYAILDFYKENPHNLNHQTISGYTTKWMLNNGLLTNQQFFDSQRHPFQNI